MLNLTPVRFCLRHAGTALSRYAPLPVRSGLLFETPPVASFASLISTVSDVVPALWPARLV